MRKMLLLSFLLVPMALWYFNPSFGQIPNWSFENWQNQNGIEVPEGWQTNSSQNFVTVKKTTDAYAGDYAVEIVVGEGFEPFPGVLLTGFKVSDPPKLLEAYVKAEIKNNDSVRIEIIAFKNSQKVGQGIWTTGDSIHLYQLISIPVIYDQENDADSVSITLTSGYTIGTGAFDRDTRLFVDNMGLSFTTGLKHDKNDIFKFYPNPAQNYIHIEFPSSSFQGHMIQFINSEGKLLRKQEIITEKTTIDISSFPRGVVFLVVINKNSNTVHHSQFKKILIL